MKKKALCILIALMMVFCLSSSCFAGIVATADEETYKEIPTKGGYIDSGIYQLTGNVKLSSAIGVKGDVTIDLNGYSITYNSSYVIYVNGGTLTLIDSSADGYGSIVNTYESSSSCAIKVANNGTLNMYAGTVQGAYGITLSSGTVNIYGGTIEGIRYYAINAEEGSLTISGTNQVEITASGTIIPLVMQYTANQRRYQFLTRTLISLKIMYQALHVPYTVKIRTMPPLLLATTAQAY